MQPDPAGLTFEDLALRPEVLGALTALGYEEPTPIQAQAIPPLLEGRDLVGQAATGTGKTAAFALPLLQSLTPGGKGSPPRALVLAPTRELAIQVAEAVTTYGRPIGARVLAVYGGQPIGGQLRALERGVDVVVATPGRALDHLKRGTLVLDDLQVVVLDEADEMFDMGFADELEAILSQCPSDRQTVLFSATMPSKIDRMARKHLRDPVRIAIERPVTAAGDAPLVRHVAHLVARFHKPAALARVLDMESPAAAIIFCRTREEVDELSEALNARGYRAEPLHGGMSQEQRDRVMNRLRGGTADLLVATDVAARGLDVDHLTHVLNYNVPAAPGSFVHRAGRVGRAGREGVAITLVEPREQGLLQAIERVTRQRLPLVPLPTVADLRARRLASTRDALVEVLDGHDLDEVRGIIGTLTEQYDATQVALAAALLAHRASNPQVELQEIPTVTATTRPARPATSSRPDRPARPDRAPAWKKDDRPDRPATGAPWSPPETGGAKRRAPRSSAPMGRVYIGAGKAAGVRPQDLVGAIANESDVPGKAIGSIEITERFSVVEVPLAQLDDVIAALRNSVIKGRKALVRRDRDS
ncbi:MAG: DEAD/DEAH box helicase [Pseudorhodobacter sp.]|nr:DEAD/DEAH box helicase [Frankiaceae bacterium]